jgi:hypothetical protein
VKGRGCGVCASQVNFIYEFMGVLQKLQTLQMNKNFLLFLEETAQKEAL